MSPAPKPRRAPVVPPPVASTTNTPGVDRDANPELFRLLVNQTRDALFVIEPETARILDANEAAIRTLGYTRDALLALRVFDVDADVSGPEAWTALVGAIFAAGTVTFTTRHRRKDGTTFPVEISGTDAVWLDRHYFIAVVRDITERETAERERAAHLRHFESMDRVNRAMQGPARLPQRLRDVLDVLLDVFGGDRAWLLHPCDPDALTWRVPVEQTRPEYPGAAAADRDLPMDPQVEALFRLALGSQGPLKYGPPPLLPLPAMTAQFQVRAQIVMLVRPSVGKPWLLGIHQCSHARLWNDDDATLFESIAHRFGDILSAVLLEDLLRHAQKMEAFGQLAGGVAHDFNNVLITIIGNSEMLELDGLATPEQADAVAEIRLAAERASRLTRQLLMFSRRQVAEVERIDVNGVVLHIARMLQRLVRDDVRVEYALQPDGAWALADPAMLEQVLMNLAVNARDAMPGGGPLLISTSLVDVDDTFAAQRPQTRAGAFVRISVCDAGCGIAPDVLPHIFEPFFTTKDIDKGTGLGLATVFGIVEQHHGWIDVETRVGEGTRFHVYLPRLAPATLTDG